MFALIYPTLQEPVPLDLPEPVTESRWHQPWSEPTRRKSWNSKHPYLAFFPVQTPVPDFGWFSALSKHPGPKTGLKVDYQRAFWGPERLLPNPDVTAILDATEVNADEFLAAIMISRAGPPVRANVSIIEVPIEDSAAASIRES